MNRRCKEFEEGLAILAEGGSSPETERHLAGCPDCAADLAALRRLVQAARVPQEDAPPSLVARAQALMPHAPRRLIARLLGSSLATAGARAAKTEEFSLHLGAEELSIRLLLTQTRKGWKITGRAPAEGWTVRYDGSEQPCGEAGRFQIAVPSLDDAAFTLRGPDVEVAVPTAAEFIGRAS